jgi:hypothetical protein
MIRELYPQAQTVEQNPNIKGEQARLRVDNFQLDGKPFSLQFFFDSAGGLHMVNLLQRADKDIDCVPMHVTCDRLEELLNQKYGKPSLRTARGDEGRSVGWNTPDTIVSLDYFPVGGRTHAPSSLLISSLSPTLSITCDAISRRARIGIIDSR